jgi:ketosteroid isomerase-like protein
MSDFQAIADRVEIEALRGEFTDAAMMCDYDRVASLFTPDGALRMPNVPVELVGREQIRAWRERREASWTTLQTTHQAQSSSTATPRRVRLPSRAHPPARRQART